MARKATKQQLSEREEFLRMIEEDWKGADLDVATKKSLVIELTREGYKPDEIRKACGFAKDFVYNTVEEFSHACLADAVKETANGQENSQPKS